MSLNIVILLDFLFPVKLQSNLREAAKSNAKFLFKSL